MAALFEVFDPTQVEARASNDLIPAGDYVMQIIDSALKPTKHSTGHYIELVFKVMEGPHEGRQFWERCNIDNPSDTAVKIAYQTMKEICDAVGVAALKDTEQLHLKPMKVKMSVRARKNEPGVMENKASYSPLDGSAPLVSSAAKVAPAAAAAAAPAAGPKLKPWEKKKA